MKRKSYTPDLEKEVIKLYTYKKCSFREINEILGLIGTAAPLRNVLEKNGIEIRQEDKDYCRPKTEIINDSRVNAAYNFESHNGAWLLGFIAAKGYLPLMRGTKNKIIITLPLEDKEVLSLIQKELAFQGEIKEFKTEEGYKCCYLKISSKNLRKKIEEYGLGYSSRRIPRISEEYKMDFIRGYFDGNGTIFELTKMRVNFKIVSSDKNLLQEIVNYLDSKFILHTQPVLDEVKKVHTIYSIRYDFRDSLILGETFYNNDYAASPRKKQHFLYVKKNLNKK